MEIKNTTRSVEEKMARLFSTGRSFSDHLMKWEDAALPDKYDHNCFEYTGQPTREEFESAVAYQRSIGASFIKLEGDEILNESFGLDAGVTLTMALQPGAVEWKLNDEVIFRIPELSELEAIEIKHYGPVYGEDFSKRNIRRLYEKLDYHGVYLGNKLVGACYSFSADGITCMDGLIVDEECRNKYIATSLIQHVREIQPDNTLILHADENDTPKDMYLKMGFDIVDRLCEYLLTKL